MSKETRASRDYLRPYNALVDIASEGLGVVEGTNDRTGVQLPGAAGASIIGITMSDAKQGERIAIQPIRPGVDVLVVANAAFARDANLAVQTNGRFAAATAGQSYRLKANEAAAAAGDIVSARCLLDEGTA